MQRCTSILWSCLALLPIAAGPTFAQSKTGVDLDQLIELANKRAAAVQKEVDEKLKPHLDALTKDYKTDWANIDDHIDAIAKLGDTVLPILLQNLEPSDNDPANVRLASNSARALAKMQPATFLDELITIAQGTNYAGKRHAVALLGNTASPRAGDVLTALLDREKSPTMSIVQALTKLEHRGGALRIAKMLPLDKTKDDEAVVAYLTAVKAPAALPEVFRALSEVRRGSQIMRYIGILRATAVRDAKAAEVLLKYYDNQKLDRSELANLSDTLAVVAPVGDSATIKRLKTMLSAGDTGRLELRTALALRALGDKAGPTILRKNLLKKTRGSKNKKYYLNHANLAEFHLEFGDYKLSVDAYKQAIQYASGNSLRSMLYISLARAQAHRKKWNFVRDALSSSGAGYDQLKAKAKEFPELAEAMKHPPVTKFMAAFGK